MRSYVVHVNGNARGETLNTWTPFNKNAVSFSFRRDGPNFSNLGLLSFKLLPISFVLLRLREFVSNQQMASSLVKSLIKSSVLGSTGTRNFCLVRSQISNHTAKWMQVPF